MIVKMMMVKTQERTTYPDVKSVYFGIGFVIIEPKTREIFIVHDDVAQMISVEGDK